jgi:MATE family multidrug resistance protein
MASSKPIPARGRTSGLDLATSFTSGSPIAQEIIASDLAECSDDEAIGDGYSDDEGLRDVSGAGIGPVLYKQPSGVAFDYRRPSMVNDPVNEPLLTRAELQKSREAERSLLRDNHLLPPKHAPEARPGIFSKLYRALFSTKIRRPSRVGDEDVSTSSDGPSESSPLLAGTSGTATPNSENLDAQWEAAVAHGIIETTWQREAKTIASYSPPLVLTFLLQYSINITSIFTVGRLGKVELGAVSCKST